MDVDKMKVFIAAVAFTAFGYWIGINEVRPKPDCVDTEIHKQPVWDGVKREWVPINRCLKHGVKVN